jgi:serpin B
VSATFKRLATSFLYPEFLYEKIMRKNVKFILILMALLTATVPGCNLNDPADAPDFEVSEKSARLIDANNQFGFELFQQVYAWEEESENIMVSPLSLALALAMTYNGAEGTTKQAMEKTLRVSGLSTSEINESYQSLVKNLQSVDPRVLLEIANAIFYRKDFSVESNFVQVNQTHYNAEVSALDFASPSALLTINGWVDNKTRGKIPFIIDQITPSHVMFLLNAIYFKGTWTKEFNPKSTVKQNFTTGSGSTVETDLMHRVDTLDYLRNDLFSAIRLSYGKENYNMYVILPEPEETIENVISKLNKENWTTWMKQFKKTNTVDIMLPRFKFPYEIELNDVLTDMGMGIAFGSAADFRGINRGGVLNIDYVKQKTFVEVNEEGTEAAAVTVVAIERTSVGPSKTYFHVTRPFLFAITEKTTGAVMFIGTVKNPASGS